MCTGLPKLFRLRIKLIKIKNKKENSSRLYNSTKRAVFVFVIFFLFLFPINKKQKKNRERDEHSHPHHRKENKPFDYCVPQL